MTASSDDPLLPVIRAALDQTRSSACITTADLVRPGPRIVYVNDAYCAMTGWSADEVIGRTPRIMQGPLTDRRVLDRLRHDLEAGRPFVGEAVNYRKDGTPFLNSWRIDPVVDGRGTITHFIATQQDITELRRVQRLLAAEKAIDRRFSELVRAATTTQANLDAMAEGIRDAVVEMVDFGQPAVLGSVRLGTTVAELRAGPGTDRLVDGAGNDEADGRDRVDGSSTPGRLDGSSTLGRGRMSISCSLSSHHGGIDGALVLHDLDRSELDFVDHPGLERVAESATRSLESLAEYERQRLVAIELQRGLMPVGTPSAPGLEVAARYQPGAFASRVGGDWYDVVSHDRRAVLVVGDMAGSGIRAAADMGRVRLLIRALLRQGADAPDVLGQLNRFCAEEDLMATALAITAESGSDALTMVTAGHPPPVIRRHDGAEVAWLTPGPPLGVTGNTAYPEQVLTLEANDVVAMFTDGLVERRDESIDVGLGRLVGRLAALPADPEAVADGLLAASLTDGPTDDIAVMAFATGQRTGDRSSPVERRAVPVER